LISAAFVPPAAQASPPLAGYNPAHLATDRDGAFISASAFAADTVLPVIGLYDDSWRGPFTPENRNTGDLFWNASSGVVFKGWRVALFNRGEMFIDCNRDTIEFFYKNKKKLDLPVGYTYRADAHVNGFMANGFEISHGRSLDALVPGLSAGITLRYLQPQSFLQQGSMTGQVMPTSATTYDFDLFLDYNYNHNAVYHRQDEEISGGYGFSADLGLAYRNEGFHAEALVRDLAGTITWYSAPYTVAHAVTPGAPVITDGYQDFSPSIVGYEGNRRVHQRLPLKTDITVGYDYGDWGGSGTVILIDDDPRTWFEGTYRFTDKVSMALGYNLDYDAFQYTLVAHGFTLALTTSDVELRDARALGGSISYVFNW